MVMGLYVILKFLLIFVMRGKAPWGGLAGTHSTFQSEGKRQKKLKT
jgi:hypothetical protein